MKHLLWGVFMYTNLYSSLTNGQHHNRTASRACGDCQPENCPIPRQCLAGKLFSVIPETIQYLISGIQQVHLTSYIDK